MNPTNTCCPSDITSFTITDYRPSKALYQNVKNNNQFRKFLQTNGDRVRKKNLQNFVRTMNCACENKYDSEPIAPFNPNYLNALEEANIQ